MKKIPLSTTSKANSGKYFAIVSDEDYEWLMKHKWTIRINKKSGYKTIARCITRNNVKQSFLMHREIMGLDKSSPMKVDHINHDTLDNRRENLRICTSSNNAMNRIKPMGRKYSSKYKGVHKKHNKWTACVRLKENRKLICLGYFLTEEDAAIAYDAKAKELFGEFAYLNFP